MAGRRWFVSDALDGRQRSLHSYERVARVYDLLAEVYSFGAIRRAKNAHVHSLRQGERVLYAGAGSCQEAVAALKTGAELTLVDSAPSMLHLAEKRLGAEAERVRFLHADVSSLLGRERFHHVVAPFFLNVFAEQAVTSRLEQLARLVHPGGRLTIVDFRGPSRSFLLLRGVQRAYYLPPLYLFHWLTSNPLHPLYDYRSLAAMSSVPLAECAATVTRFLGVPLFESLSFRVGS